MYQVHFIKNEYVFIFLILSVTSIFTPKKAYFSMFRRKILNSRGKKPWHIRYRWKGISRENMNIIFTSSETLLGKFNYALTPK